MYYTTARLCHGVHLAAAIWLAVSAIVLSSEQVYAQEAQPGLDILSNMYYADALVHSPNMRAGSTDEPGRMVAMIATAIGKTASVASSLQSFGAEILFRDDIVGYLRIALAIEEWNNIRRIDGIIASRIEGNPSPMGWIETKRLRQWTVSRGYRAMMPLSVTVDSSSGPGGRDRDPHATRPLNAATFSTPSAVDDAFGLLDFRSRHPSFDGRGVTVAIFETNATQAAVDHPALSAPSLDIHGAPQSKILAVRAATDEGVVHDLEEIVATESVYWRHAGIGVVLPAAGRYRFGRVVVDERLYGVLWEPSSATAWIDLNQNGNFLDDPLSHVGDISLPTRASKSAAWAAHGYLLTSTANELRVHRLGGSHHPSMTASVAAGSRRADHLAVGVAPAARLFLSDSGSGSVSAFLEGLIVTARRPEIDVISISQLAPVSMPASDAQLTAVIVDRIVSEYNRLIVQGVGNSGGAEQAATSGSLALSVGAMANRESLRRFFEKKASLREFVWGYSERGPNSLGSLRPLIVGPAEWISADNCDAEASQRSSVLLPRCHALSSGTSAATPAVAGLAAILLSAGRQSGRNFSAMQVREALLLSARFLSGVRPVDQGFGVPQIERAWQILLGTKTERLEVLAPVRHVLNHSDHEAGLYFREGWEPGRRETVEIRLRRTSQDRSSKSYALRLRGDSETFHVIDRVTLSAECLTSVHVTIAPGSVGIKSAILEVLELSTGLAIARIPLTVVVAQPLTPGRAVTLRAKLEARGRIEYVFAVPPQATFLSVRVRRSCETSVQLFEPAGFLHQRNTPLWLVSTSEPSDERFSIPDPMPGTWIMIAQRRAEACVDSPADLTAELTIQKATIQPRRRSIRLRGVKIDATATADLELRAYAGTSTRYEAGTAAEVINIDVTQETSLLSIVQELASLTDGLYLYNCTGSLCYRYAVLPPGTQPRSISLAQPEIGRWKLVWLRPASTRSTDTTNSIRIALAARVPLSCRAVDETNKSLLPQHRQRCVVPTSHEQRRNGATLIVAATKHEVTGPAFEPLLGVVDFQAARVATKAH